MKFNCSKEARKAAKTERELKACCKSNEKQKALRRWHLKFAWLPVDVSMGKGDCRWLEYVDRVWVDRKYKLDNNFMYAPAYTFVDLNNVYQLVNFSQLTAAVAVLLVVIYAMWRLIMT